MLPDFNRLKVFYHIYTEQSVALAAKRLNITPSAVSQALAKLEEEIQTSLFTRLHKKLVPTPAARQLFDTVAPFVRDLKVQIKEIHNASQTPSGMIRMGAPLEFGTSYLPGAMASFRKEYPGVCFTLKLGDTSEILSMIHAGEVDFGLIDTFFTRGRIDEDLSLYHIEPLIDEEVLMVCGKAYFERELRRDCSFGNLSAKGFISYQKSSMTLKRWFVHHFNRPVRDLNCILIVDSHQAIVTGLRHQLGLGVIASHIIKDDIEAGLMVPIRTGKEEIINKISLAQLLDKVPGLAEKTFIRHLLKDIRSSESQNPFGPLA